MKVLVSSKQLADKLKEIDFNCDNVEYVSLEGDYLSLMTRTKVVELYVASDERNNTIVQTDRRWDWIKETVSQIDEQPIVLDIQQWQTKVILEY